MFAAEEEEDEDNEEQAADEMVTDTTDLSSPQRLCYTIHGDQGNVHPDTDHILILFSSSLSLLPITSFLPPSNTVSFLLAHMTVLPSLSRKHLHHGCQLPFTIMKVMAKIPSNTSFFSTPAVWKSQQSY